MAARRYSFSSWLRHQSKRQDPVGEFARDVRADPDWPRTRSPRSWPYRRRLEARGASMALHNALSLAYLEWCALDTALAGAGVMPHRPYPVAYTSERERDRDRLAALEQSPAPEEETSRPAEVRRMMVGAHPLDPRGRMHAVGDTDSEGTPDGR